MRAGSKILPQVAHLIADGSVSEFIPDPKSGSWGADQIHSPTMK